MLHEAQNLYDEAVNEVSEKTGREYIGADTSFGIHITEAMDGIAFFIGESIIADNKKH